MLVVAVGCLRSYSRSAASRFPISCCCMVPSPIFHWLQVGTGAERSGVHPQARQRNGPRKVMLLLCAFADHDLILCPLQVWEGQGVVASFRKLVGATDPLKAEPGTIRGDFGRVTGRNIVHASDSPDNGEREAGEFLAPCSPVECNPYYLAGMLAAGRNCAHQREP